MKLCPMCDTAYPSSHTTCNQDGAVLIDSGELEPGTLIRNKYRVVRTLGQGGMGTVYLAEHMLLNRLRALKFMSSELSRNPKFLRRFRQEAQATIELRHPNIVEVVDLDQAEDGSPYIAMEYVDGPPLRDAIMRGPFPVERALHIAKGIASGLSQAHSRGIIHRDVKPENVLLAPGMASVEIPKLLDFGIAAMKETSTGISRTRGLMLTPDYAAPEQWMGLPSEQLDGRVDLYALGGVLYEMLTGRTCFHAHNTEGWMYQHLQTERTAPSTGRPELAQWVGLDSLVLRLLSKDREQRPASADQVLSELGAIRFVPAPAVPPRPPLQPRPRPTTVEPNPQQRPVRPPPPEARNITEQRPPTQALSTPPPPLPATPTRKMPVWIWAVVAAVCVLLPAAIYVGRLVYRPAGLPAATQPIEDASQQPESSTPPAETAPPETTDKSQQAPPAETPKQAPVETAQAPAEKPAPAPQQPATNPAAQHPATPTSAESTPAPAPPVARPNPQTASTPVISTETSRLGKVCARTIMYTQPLANRMFYPGQQHLDYTYRFLSPNTDVLILGTQQIGTQPQETKIALSGQEPGWVQSSAVAATCPAVFTCNTTNVYLSPTTTHSTYSLPAGTAVTVRQTVGNISDIQVVSTGNQGYVHASDVAAGCPSSPAANNSSPSPGTVSSTEGTNSLPSRANAPIVNHPGFGSSGNAVLTILSGMHNGANGANPLARVPYKLMRDDYYTTLAKGGFPVKPGITPKKAVNEFCKDKAQCLRVIQASVANPASSTMSNALGTGVLPGVEPGDYYLMIYGFDEKQKPVYWNTRINLQAGPNTFVLNDKNASRYEGGILSGMFSFAMR